MQRRTLLKTFGSIGAATAIGGAGVLASSGGAQATAGSNIENPAPVTSDGGKISYVSVQTTGRMNWDGFDTPAKKGRILVSVALKRNGNIFLDERVHDTGNFGLADNSWGGSGEDTSISGDTEDGQEGYIASDADWDIIQSASYDDDSDYPSDPVSADPLYADDSDGQSVTTRVILTSTYMLMDADGKELTGTQGYPDRPETSADFVIEVNNQESSTSFGGEDGDGDTDDTAGVGVGVQS